MKIALVRIAFALGFTLAASPLMAQPKEKPKKLALLVGINNYNGTGLNVLSHAVSDMEGMKAELEKAGFEVEAPLLNQQATKQNIEAALKRIKAHRKVGDLVLIAMSGHGLQTRNTAGEEDAFFCPAGCERTETDSMVSLTTVLQGLGSKGVNLVLIDACRNDPRRGIKGIQGNELKDRLPTNTAVLFSCSAGQSSFETTRMNGEKALTGHGVFFFHVLEALRGEARNNRGEVPWYLFVDYVTDKVNAKAKEWFDDQARQMAKDQGVTLADLKLQTPHLLNNLIDRPVLARLAAPKPADKPPPVPAGSPVVRVEDQSRQFARWDPDGYCYSCTPEKEQDGKLFIRYQDGTTEWAPKWRVSKANLVVGNQVECDWKATGKYYAGQIAQINGNSVRVNYSDGDVEDTTVDRLRLKLFMRKELGSPVMGRWDPDGYWYSGIIKEIRDGKYLVAFDDSDQAWLEDKHVLAYQPTWGDRVQGNWKNGGPFYNGKIAERKNDRVLIHYDDGDEEWTTMAKVRVNYGADSPRVIP